jgi:predicted outer membrane repeat protein
MFKPTVICKLFATGSPRNPRRSSTRLRPALMALDERQLLSGIVVHDPIVVDNPTDIPRAGQIDLRQAIEKANTQGGRNTINFSSVFDTRQTITLMAGQLQVTDEDLTIHGPAAGLTVNGNNNSRILDVASEKARVVISNMAITGGYEVKDYGGGVYNRGNLTLVNCNVLSNVAATSFNHVYGGGLYNYGVHAELTLENSTVLNNSVNRRSGGGVGAYGGGLANYEGTVFLENSTFNNNESLDGGGVYNYGKAYLTNCTFVSNTAAGGGGLLNDGDAWVRSCTFVNNVAGGRGGGIYAQKSLDMWNTIVAGNTGDGGDYHAPAPDVYALVHSGGNDNYNKTGGHNLIGDTAGSSGWGTTDLQNVANPGLLPFGYYGGPTPTVALAPNSPAIGEGMKVMYKGKWLETDQRFFKLDTPDPDIGAYQFQKS